MVTSKLSSMSTGFYQKKDLCPTHTELAFFCFSFPYSFLYLKGKPSKLGLLLQGHCHEKDTGVRHGREQATLEG